jgi:hypothetical protein
MGVGDDLRVATARIEQHRIFGLGHGAPDLQVSDAVIHAKKRSSRCESKGARDGGARAQARPQARTLGKGDEVELARADTGPLQRRREHIGAVGRVMVGGLARVDATRFGSQHRAFAGKDLDMATAMADHSHADGVRGAFDAEREHCGCEERG